MATLAKQPGENLALQLVELDVASLLRVDLLRVRDLEANRSNNSLPLQPELKHLLLVRADALPALRQLAGLPMRADRRRGGGGRGAGKG